jgi:cytochrome P450
MAAMIEILGQGIVFAEGEQWKNKRKTLSKAFKHDLILENIPKLKKIINHTLDKFESRCSVGPETYKYNMMDISNHIFAGFMTQCFFGVE